MHRLKQLFSRKEFVLYSYAIVTIAVYFFGFEIGFLSDDFKFLHGFNTKGISQFNQNFDDPFFLPITHLLDYIQFLFFGLNPKGYHIVSLSIHIANAWMIFLILKYFSLKKASKFPFFSGLTFLILPYQTETVLWFSANSYIYATFFFLIGIWFHSIYYFLRKKKYLYLSGLFFFISILCKETTIIFPLLIAIGHLFFPRKHIKYLQNYSLFGAIIISFHHSSN